MSLSSRREPDRFGDTRRHRVEDPSVLAGEPKHARGNELLIGGLLSLTGDWSTLGRTGEVALHMAERDVNAYLGSIDSKVTVKVVVEDTRLDPARALDAMRSLARRGARVFAGPQSSAELRVLKPVADAEGLIVISPSSTAGTLSLPNDNVLRFCPDEALEGDAIVALMWAEGIRTVVPIWREDAGNAGLATAMRSRFVARGGTVLAGASYAATDVDPAAAVAAVANQVQGAGAGPVAVYLASFDEAVNVFHHAAASAALSAVPWYGSDGVALSAVLKGDASASAFAVAAHYPVPVFGLDPAAKDKWQPLAAEIEQRTGLQADAFALALYDEVWVAALAHLALQDAKGKKRDDELLRTAIVGTAAHHFGATGWTVLNANGDRKLADFDFWALRGSPAAWTLVGRYIGGVLSVP